MRRVLVAGVGNVLFGDHGFGVEVARRLRGTPLPQGTIVEDFGTRSVHRAFKLLGPQSVDMLVLVDTVSRGGEPGTVYLLQSGEELAQTGTDGEVAARHPSGVFSTMVQMGDSAPAVRIVGCEPYDTSERIGLSAKVEGAVEPAIRLVRSLIDGNPPDAATP